MAPSSAKAPPVGGAAKLTERLSKHLPAATWLLGRAKRAWGARHLLFHIIFQFAGPAWVAQLCEGL